MCCFLHARARGTLFTAADMLHVNAARPVSFEMHGARPCWVTSRAGTLALWRRMRCSVVLPRVVAL
eukprot:2920556-Pleurochrysis_carterae.AAC.1